MLCLSENDIVAAVTLDQIMDQVEAAFRFYETQDFLMPLRTHLDYGQNTLLLMPCFTRHLFGTKLVTLFPGNAALNLPVVDAMMLINDARTGAALALLNGRILTALRTGAVGGVGVRHLSPPETSTLGIVGTGAQGFQQARFAATARNLTRITVFDAMPGKAAPFADQLAAALPGPTIQVARTADDLVASSEVIVTATTSNRPVLPSDHGLLAGRHFVGIGSYKPTMREFPEALFRQLDTVYVDTEHALEETGDLRDPLTEGWIRPDQTQTIGQLLNSGSDPAETRGRTTLFKSVGMALLDVFVSELIYRQALEKGLGQTVAL